MNIFVSFFPKHGCNTELEPDTVVPGDQSETETETDRIYLVGSLSSYVACIFVVFGGLEQLTLR